MRELTTRWQRHTPNPPLPLPREAHVANPLRRSVTPSVQQERMQLGRDAWIGACVVCMHACATSDNSSPSSSRVGRKRRKNGRLYSNFCGVAFFCLWECSAGNWRLLRVLRTIPLLGPVSFCVPRSRSVWLPACLDVVATLRCLGLLGGWGGGIVHCLLV